MTVDEKHSALAADYHAQPVPAVLAASTRPLAV